ncbi:hypothetical protein [Methylobacterium sp. J-068]|uniref:hypothetical protein n=1 Tax=Methylobacterium sp. J-068 TaxID=2836649 RepID=UPI001FBAF2A6|nr:hypothetical protein [Methylobacterium sp. J-068]MCJ2032734.1 hypothetical protein [Methylobacterium sp. J-068]
MAEAIDRAHGAALDGLARTLWAGVAAEQISDIDAARLVEALDARRMAVKSTQRPASLGPLRLEPTRRRKPQRPPVRSQAIERRRRLAASGPMPPSLAARFTTGELAVLRIVADEFRAQKVCALCLDAIAARAGVSRTLAKDAIRQARRLGMVEVRERRRTGAKSLPNLVTVIDREWLAWIKCGAARRQQSVSTLEETTTHPKSEPSSIGGRISTTTDNLLILGERHPAKPAKRLPKIRKRA